MKRKKKNPRKIINSTGNKEKKSTFSCHQIAKQKLNTLWIFFAKLGGLRACSAASVPFQSSPRFEAACPFQLTKQAFGGEGGGEKWMTARLSPVPADWEKGRALPRPCRGASLFSEQLAPSEMCSRLVGVQVAGVRVRAESDYYYFLIIFSFFFFFSF